MHERAPVDLLLGQLYQSLQSSLGKIQECGFCCASVGPKCSDGGPAGLVKHSECLILALTLVGPRKQSDACEAVLLRSTLTDGYRSRGSVCLTHPTNCSCRVGQIRFDKT